jgi:DNA polymerase-1
VTPGKNISNTVHTYHLIDTDEKILELAALLREQNEICFSTESTHADANLGELIGLAFSLTPSEGYYVPTPADP